MNLDYYFSAWCKVLDKLEQAELTALNIESTSSEIMQAIENQPRLLLLKWNLSERIINKYGELK